MERSPRAGLASSSVGHQEVSLSAPRSRPDGYLRGRHEFGQVVVISVERFFIGEFNPIHEKKFGPVEANGFGSIVLGSHDLLEGFDICLGAHPVAVAGLGGQMSMPADLFEVSLDFILAVRIKSKLTLAGVDNNDSRPAVDDDDVVLRDEPYAFSTPVTAGIPRERATMEVWEIFPRFRSLCQAFAPPATGWRRPGTGRG